MKFGGEDGPLETVELFRSARELFEFRSGNVSKSAMMNITIPAGHHCVFWSAQGTIVARKDIDPKWTVLAPESVGFLSGPCNVTLNVARGNHEVYAMAWDGEAATSLNRWIEAQYRSNALHRTRPTIRTKPFATIGKRDLETLSRDARNGEPWVLPIFYSYVCCAVAECLKGNDELGLTPMPSDLPPIFIALVEKVKETPDSPWPLKEAADFVGYSPFHFSRVFKSSVGYGFHEFVDRSRTEMAVKLLTNTDDTVEVIASASGFGTAQSLRESVKEHLGLLPSELRGVSEDGF